MDALWTTVSDGKKADVTTRPVAYDRLPKTTRPASSTSSSSATAWIRPKPTAVDS